MAQNVINVASIQADLAVDSANFERGLARGREALAAIDREMDTLRKDADQGAISTQQLADRLATLASVQSTIAGAMQSAYSSTTNFHTGLEVLNAQAATMTGRAGSMGFALMQLGAIVDDVQYGFQGVVNNIGPLVYGLSGSMSIAAGAQLAAVASYQLYDKWDKLMELFGDTSRVDHAMESLEGMSKLLKELREGVEGQPGFFQRWFGPFDVSKSVAQLEKLEKEVREKKSNQKAAEGLDDFKTEDEKKAGKRFEKIIGGQARGNQSGIDALANKMATEDMFSKGPRAFLKKDDQAAYDEAEAERDRYKAIANPTDTQKEVLQRHEETLTELGQKARHGAVQSAREEIGAGANSAEGRDKLAARFRNNPAYGDLGDVVSGKKETEDEQQERESQQAAWEHKGQRNNAEYVKKQAKEEERKADEKKRLVDQLNRQGAENVEHAKQEAEREKKENAKTGREKLPGVDDVAKKLFAQRAASGRGTADVSRIITQALMRKGMNRGDAKEAAGEITKDAKEDVQGKVAKKLLDGPQMDPKERAHSEQFDGQELARRVQGGVNNDPMKQMNDKLDQQIKYLADIARASGRNPLTLEFR